MEPLTAEQKALASDDDAVAGADRIAARYARIFPEHADDIRSSAAWGLVNAAASYAPDEGNVWEKWSRMHARYGVLGFLKSARLRKKGVWEGSVRLGPDGDDVADDGGSERRFGTLNEIIEGLPDKHRKLLVRVYDRGMTACEAGVDMGYSEKHGAKIHREAIGLLRRRLSA